MTHERKDIPTEKFTVMIDPPSNRLAAMCISFYDDGRVNLNGKLMSAIENEKIRLEFTSDFKNLKISKDSSHEKSTKIPKNGSILWLVAAEALKKNSIMLPAKYDCWKSIEQGSWQGVLVENPTIKPAGKHQGSKKP